MPKVNRLVCRYSNIGLALFLAAITIMLIAIPSVSAQEFQLSGPDSRVRAGYFVIEASRAESEADVTSLSQLRLQQSTTTDFSDPKYYAFFADFSELTVTGVASGDYYLRLVDAQGRPRSNVIPVTVAHYPLWQALTLFFLGLILFSILVATQFYYAKRTPKISAGGIEHE